MPVSRPIPTRCVRFVTACLAATSLLVLAAGQQAEPGGLRVGTFDSRAVAVSFARSEMFNRELQRLTQEYETAKTAGDDEQVSRLEAAVQARQEQFHRQAFSTAPVDDILSRIVDKLEGIAEGAGVDVIVSMWAISYGTNDSRLVDVTDAIVELYEPGEQTKATIRELRDQPPVTLEELEGQHDH